MQNSQVLSIISICLKIWWRGQREWPSGSWRSGGRQPHKKRGGGNKAEVSAAVRETGGSSTTEGSTAFACSDLMRAPFQPANGSGMPSFDASCEAN